MPDKKIHSDLESLETQEWLDALSTMVQFEGSDRAKVTLDQLFEHASQAGVPVAAPLTSSSYVNTIPVQDQIDYPGDLDLEAKIVAIVRFNAVVLVLRVKRDVGGLDGHISSFASIATLYEVGFNHFWRGRGDDHLEDLVYFQGHSSEGNYARAFIEGRLDEQHLINFRQETGGHGLSSYPHPWLMPSFWQFASVSLGLGPLQGIFQAQFMHYLKNRGLLDTSGRKVWIFTGDGEMDEPESISGLTIAARENLDNLVYVVNCNLQRLDGLVRSNHRIITELENLFRGAGWHVIKILWGSEWDALFAKDKQGVLAKALGTCVDGQMQTFTRRGGAYFREHFFNKDPQLAALVADLSDEELENLSRGGHDPVKVYAAYKAAVEHTGQPVCILAHCVKGFGLGKAAESQNIAHNATDMNEEQLKTFRARFDIPVDDKQLLNLEFYKPEDDSPEMRYLHERREQLGGYLPARDAACDRLTVPVLSDFDVLLKGTKTREMSSTMAFGRILNVMLKDKNIGQRIVPIFSDEVRTFGMEALFRQIGVYSPHGQLYEPEDKAQLMYYKEASNGQMFEEGIHEAGCMAAWIAAATSYSTHRFPMVPVFTFYSMFGFQRVGDFIWAAADMRARGFLIGATAGRTTLSGEGLQHQDGHNLMAAVNVPNCKSYDPSFGYEMAVIVQDGLRRMLEDQEDVFYYITAMNEKYAHPEMPSGVEDGILKGLYLFHESEQTAKLKVQLLGSGTIFNEIIAAAELLDKDFGVKADIWGAPSFNELRREALDVQRQNLLSPGTKPVLSYVETCLKDRGGPVIASTDYVKGYADQIREFVPASYTVLGTDGFGRSDTREKLRRFFEVDRHYIVFAALSALAAQGDIESDVVKKAMKKYNIDANKPNPVSV